MNRRRYRLDAEAQVSDANAAGRAEHRDARRFDRTVYVRVGGVLLDADRVPDLRDVVEEAW